MSSFADDTTLRGVNGDEDCKGLQKDLEKKVYHWAEDIGM